MKKTILKIYAYILSIGGLYYLWIRLTGLSIPCFYRSTSGLLCPGCGATRMFQAMLRLDLTAAFHYNPVMFVFFFVWNLIAILCFFGKFRFVSSPKFLYSALAATIAALLIYGIARNFY